VLYLGPSTYDDATGYRSPKITAINKETGGFLWEAEQTESVLVGIDSRYVYAWHLAQIVPMAEPDYPWYWFASDITALNKTSGQIGRPSHHLSDGIDCSQQYDCLPDDWSESDFVNCCVLGGSVKEEITNNAESGLTFLIGKPSLSELTYEYQGVVYKSTCAVYGGVGTGCGALQALDKQTDELLWMMTFRERGMSDFSISIVDGILYVLTDQGVGAFKL
jgi:outer membrane protein assembly factor BamB